MNCPACGQGLPAGLSERCPFCATLLTPPVEGSLAPNLSPFAPTPSGPEEPLREIPGLRKRERTWKDEVKERVSDRRLTRSARPGDPVPLPASLGAPEGAPAEAPTARAQGESGADSPQGPGRLRLRELDEDLARLTEPEDLPLRPPEQGEPAPSSGRSSTFGAGLLLADPEDEPETEDWSLGGASAKEEAAPVERPAAALERLLAALLDTLFWGSLSVLVVYFASRVARVAPWELRPGWPYLLGYLGFLGLSYAVYFTGATGQTLGKMATRLRVVDSEGRPPVYGRALVRAVLGTLSVALAALGLLPMLFDPARRTLHDRLTRTRVVKSA